MRHVALASLFIAGIALGNAACYAEPPAVSEHPVAAHQAALVTIQFFADGVPSGSCSGVLVGPQAVLTAGHCAAGKTSAMVVAPNAGGRKARSHRAWWFDWSETATFTGSSSLHDVAIIALETPIKLKKYPEIASDSAEGARTLTVRRIKDASGKIAFQGLPGVAAPSTHRSAYRIDTKSSLSDSGGPVFDSRTGEIVGVVSAHGSTGKTFYVSKSKSLLKWLRQQLLALLLDPPKPSTGSTAPATPKPDASASPAPSAPPATSKPPASPSTPPASSKPPATGGMGKTDGAGAKSKGGKGGKAPAADAGTDGGTDDGTDAGADGGTDGGTEEKPGACGEGQTQGADGTCACTNGDNATGGCACDPGDLTCEPPVCGGDKAQATADSETCACTEGDDSCAKTCAEGDTTCTEPAPCADDDTSCSAPPTEPTPGEEPAPPTEGNPTTETPSPTDPAPEEPAPPQDNPVLEDPSATDDGSADATADTTYDNSDDAFDDGGE